MGLDIYHKQLVTNRKTIKLYNEKRVKELDLPNNVDYYFLDKTELELKSDSDRGETMPGVIESFYDFVKKNKATLNVVEEEFDYETTFNLFGYGDHKDYETSSIGLLEEVKDYSGKVHKIKGMAFYKLSDECLEIRKLLKNRVAWKFGEGFTNQENWAKNNFPLFAKQMLEALDRRNRKISEIRIEYDHFITKKETVKIYFAKEIGYERKGMKDKFYKNYPMYHIILDKEEAEDLIHRFAEDPTETRGYLNMDRWKPDVSFLKFDW